MIRKQVLKALYAILTTFVLFLSLSLSSKNVFAEFTVPTLTAPVMDQVGVLSSTTTNHLNELLKNVQNSGGSQIQVLIVKSLDGLAIEDATFQVAKAWGLGDAQKDDGVLLFVSIDDRWTRIEVGQGLEGSLTDAHSRRIIDNAITPEFKAGNFDQGISNGVAEILQHTDPEFNTGDLQKTSNLKSKLTPQDIIKIIFIILWILFVLFGSSNRRGVFGGRGYGGGGFGGGGFGGGSGRGWSGGGGGFSGGGSSGRW